MVRNYIERENTHTHPHPHTPEAFERLRLPLFKRHQLQLWVSALMSYPPLLTTGTPTTSGAGLAMRDSISTMPSGEVLAGLRTLEQDQIPITLTTPVHSLLADFPQSRRAVAVGPVSPPIPYKLAEKIWQGEYIDLQELLPSRLGAPSTTVLDALLKSEKVVAKKNIASIEDWVVCFNTYTSVVALKKPERVRDLLAYCSTIVKASGDFIGSPWLDYDIQFRQQAATQPDAEWAKIDASIWTVQFSRATPEPQYTAGGTEKKGQSYDRFPRQRYSPYPTPQNRICFRWNAAGGCRLVVCRFAHICSSCRDASHGALECPQNRGNRSGQVYRPQGGPPGAEYNTPPFRPPPGDYNLPFRPPPGRR